MTPVVFATHKTDVIEHSWRNNEGVERTSRCSAAGAVSRLLRQKENVCNGKLWPT